MPAKKAVQPEWPCPWCDTMPGVEKCQGFTGDELNRYYIVCNTTKCKVNPRTNDYAKRIDAVRAWDAWKKTK